MDVSPELRLVLGDLVSQRVESGETQRVLEERLGLGEGHIAKLEAGWRRPTGFTLAIWAEGLGLELRAVRPGLIGIRQGLAPPRFDVAMSLPPDLRALRS